MKPLISIAGIGAALFLQACDRDTVAGTNNETHTKGTFYQANGKPAVGARVRVYSASQQETDSTTPQVGQEYVDANGNVALKLKPGHYSLVADSGSISAFIDSIFSDGDKVAIPVDTLRPTGTITGYLRVQPMHSPSIAWVHLMRTNLYTKVDSTGFFRFSNVPAGSLDLVAVSHLPEYTPTHKLVRALPDSTVHVDTIDLVYNGLPLVTGIAATYDTLSGVVTLTWHDTAYARKAGYVIYRQTGASSWASPPERGYTESSIYHDTVFGGFGATPSRYDSAEFDLTYWVGAKGTDQITQGPIWNKVSLHAKSPALAKRWKVEWTSFTPLANDGSYQDGCSLDTLDAGIGVLCRKWDLSGRSEYKNVLHVVRPDGTRFQNELPPFSSMEPNPVFWNGKIWLVRGIPNGKIVVSSVIYDPAIPIDTSTVRYPIFDSIRIYSSPDGIHWDSTTQPTGSEEATATQLRAVGANLLVYPSSNWFNRFTGMKGSSALSEIRLSFQGVWSFSSQIDTFLLGQSKNDYIWAFSSWNAQFTWIDPLHNWTFYTPQLNGGGEIHSFLIPGLSSDTTSSVITVPGTPSLRATSELLAISLPYTINLASPEIPAIWQRILSPESETSGYCFWRGQLVVLGKTGIHFATITPNQ